MNDTRGCTHWIGSDAKGRRCGVAYTGLYPFCVKHLEVQRRRAVKRVAKDREAAKRADATWFRRNAPRLAGWRVQLEQAQAEYARRTRSATDDRAAYGGKTHTAITRSQRSVLSDSNVARVVELQGLIKRLTADIARAERLGEGT